MAVFFSSRFLFFSTIVPFLVSISTIVPFLVSIALYRLDNFDPAPLPSDAFTSSSTSIPPLLNDKFLAGAESIGVGLLDKPEDIAYHKDSGLIYTGCVDGWVKRVKVHDSANDSVVEDWVNTGGRPLGIAFGLHGEVIVADAYKGLLNISGDGKKTELLTEEADGVRFKLTDAVTIADNGVLYFTDASYKYTLHEVRLDILEGKSHGRLMSFDPTTKVTRVLLRDLYFANGVSMSPDQTYLIFCETPILLAGSSSEGNSGEKMKDSSGVAGTGVYISPEVKNKSKSVDQKADIYSFGIMFFELWNHYGSETERAYNLMKLGKREIPNDWTESFPVQSALLAQLLNPDPLERPSARDLLKAIPSIPARSPTGSPV